MLTAGYGEDICTCEDCFEGCDMDCVICEEEDFDNYLNDDYDDEDEEL